MVGRVITSDACVAEGFAALLKLEPRFAAVQRECPVLPLRLKGDGFTAVLDAIVGQQISLAAANAIWGRLQDAELSEPRSIANASDDALRACGLSRPKVRYVRALVASDIDYAALRAMPNDAVFKTLTELPGIGPWTAEIYAMFSLGRADMFAPGDLALQVSAQTLFELPGRPSEKQLRQMSLAWSPWRSVAARALWAYYRVIKQREGIR